VVKKRQSTCLSDDRVALAAKEHGEKAGMREVVKPFEIRMPQGQTGRGAHARGWAMTEI